jgi:hypothetical protein
MEAAAGPSEALLITLIGVLVGSAMQESPEKKSQK